MDYPILRALAAEWDESLRGAIVEAAYSQEARELAVELEADPGASTLHVRCVPPRPLIWRSPGTGRARRNTATVLESIVGRRIAGVRTAERDRHLFIDLEGGGSVQVVPFGPRPNVLVVDDAGMVADAFLHAAALRGRPAPTPRASWWPEEPADLLARWDTGRTVVGALLHAMPTLGSAHAREAARRAGVDPHAGADTILDSIERLGRVVLDLDLEIKAQPRPQLLLVGGVPEAVTLVEMAAQRPGDEVRTLESVDEAVRAWATAGLAVARRESAYATLIGALASATDRLARSANEIEAELRRPSRAEISERNAHLLMAAGAGAGAGLTTITVPDVLAEGEAPAVSIKLDPALTVFANAERLYDRARRARKARDHAAERHAQVVAGASRARALLEEVRALEAAGASPRALDAWRAEHAGEIERLVRTGGQEFERLPYRRFELPGGWEVRVGRGAKDNVVLTTRHASPHDYWLHARGVSGSHVVLRRPSRDAKPPRAVLEAAAGLAAWFSKARTQSLVPVSYTERKYVRPIKGGPPGLVRLEREEVIMAEPRGL